MHSIERLDYSVIVNFIDSNSKVLDLGCGDGNLLRLIADKRNAVVQGIELNQDEIYKCVEKGVSVFHDDFENGLKGYPDKLFDYVILNQSMQETKNAGFVIKEALRVGKKVIVGFPNFAFFKARLRMFFMGKAPITKSLPYRWYSTPNLHFLSITDFIDFCKDNNVEIIKKCYLGRNKKVTFFANFFAQNAIFLISK